MDTYALTYRRFHFLVSIHLRCASHEARSPSRTSKKEVKSDTLGLYGVTCFNYVLKYTTAFPQLGFSWYAGLNEYFIHYVKMRTTSLKKI